MKNLTGGTSLGPVLASCVGVTRFGLGHAGRAATGQGHSPFCSGGRMRLCRRHRNAFTRRRVTWNSGCMMVTEV